MEGDRVDRQRSWTINHETLRQWVRRAEVDAGQRPGLTTDERARIRELERENQELRRANEILKAASAFFGAELDRQSHEVVAFIDAHRERFGVEPICRVLTEHGCKIAPNTYWVAKKRPPSARALRDAELVVEIRRVYDENLFVYGADKVWAQLNREGIRVGALHRRAADARRWACPEPRRGKAFTVTTDQRRPARPTRRSGRPGVRGRRPRTDSGSPTSPTSRRTPGWVYVAFIIDVYSRMVVGWQASRSLRSDLAIDALGDGGLEPSTRRRRPVAAGPSLATGACNTSSIRYSERLADNAIVASVGSKGDSYDNAMAESFNGLYKWELIYRQGPWRGLDDVEFATMTYVDWFNHRRLHGEITTDAAYTTPAELRGRLLPSDHPGPRAGHPITRAVTRPGRFRLPSRHSGVAGRGCERVGGLGRTQACVAGRSRLHCVDR